MLSKFYDEASAGIVISRQQGSDFAKQVANDFNPLHDVDAKRFCVPGDLLFSLIIEKYGISEKMKFNFEGMVTEQNSLRLPDAAGEIKVGEGEKIFLTVHREGNLCEKVESKESLIKSYVEFSGTTFPHILVPLLAAKEVMINPDRPMVMYQSMSIELTDFDFSSLTIEMPEAKFEFEGKRGNVVLPFNFLDGDRIVGTGEKHMLVSGLKAYDDDKTQKLIRDFNEWKSLYLSSC